MIKGSLFIISTILNSETQNLNFQIKTLSLFSSDERRVFVENCLLFMGEQSKLSHTLTVTIV